MTTSVGGFTCAACGSTGNVRGYRAGVGRGIQCQPCFRAWLDADIYRKRFTYLRVKPCRRCGTPVLLRDAVRASGRTVLEPVDAITLQPHHDRAA